MKFSKFRISTPDLDLQKSYVKTMFLDTAAQPIPGKMKELIHRTIKNVDISLDKTKKRFHKKCAPWIFLAYTQLPDGDPARIALRHLSETKWLCTAKVAQIATTVTESPQNNLPSLKCFGTQEGYITFQLGNGKS